MSLILVTLPESIMADQSIPLVEFFLTLVPVISNCKNKSYSSAFFAFLYNTFVVTVSTTGSIFVFASGGATTSPLPSSTNISHSATRGTAVSSTIAAAISSSAAFCAAIMASISPSSFAQPPDDPECNEFSSLLRSEKSGRGLFGDGDS